MLISMADETNWQFDKPSKESEKLEKIVMQLPEMIFWVTRFMGKEGIQLGYTELEVGYNGNHSLDEKSGFKNRYDNTDFIII